MTDTSASSGDPGSILPRSPATSAQPKALTLVPKIMAAHQKAISAQRGSLDYAMEAGDLLKRAKETVGRGWLKWLEANCPNIPQTTASLYMRLWENKDKIDQQHVASLGDDGKLSIRSAAKLIPPKNQRGPSPPKLTPEERIKAAVTAVTKAKVGDWLEALDADEVFLVLKDQWDKEKLEALAKLIADHLAKSKEPPPPNKPTGLDQPSLGSVGGSRRM